MSEALRQDSETPAPARPFAASDAGADYFATDVHYQALAGRVIARLRGGPGFVLITGDPPPDPRRLAPVLTKAASGSHAVGIVTCGPELNREQLFHAAPPAAAPLFVFDDADRLSDVQLGGFCEALASGDGAKPAAVLLARPACAARLERLQPWLSREGLATHFRLNELERDEVETFIGRQLPPGEAAPAFTAEAITAIADFSGGDPATVNRLSRLMLEFAQSASGNGEKKSVGERAEPPTAPSSDATGTYPESQPRSRRGAVWGLPIVILLCLLAAGGFFIVSGDRISLPVATAVHHDAEPAADASLPAPATPIVPAEKMEPPTPSDVPNTVIASEPPPTSSATETPAVEPSAPVSAAPLNQLILSAEEIAALLTRGDALVSQRDIATARLFYERAAEAGDAQAALRIGATYDPTFLDRAGIRGETGSLQQALYWYRRARDLGNAEAERRLKDLRAQ